MATPAAAAYLIERHKAVSAQFDAACKPGDFRPGIVEVLQRELRGLEKAIAGIGSPPSADDEAP